MKFVLKQVLALILLVSLTILSTSSKLKLRSNRAIKARVHSKYDFSPVIADTWTREIAEGYRDMAALGYVPLVSATEQLANIKLKDKKDVKKVGYLFQQIFEVQKWEHISTFTGEKDTRQYSYSIIRNVGKDLNKGEQKIVVTFSGTKGPKQMIGEFWYSGGVTYADKSPVQIMSYFSSVYNVIKNNLIESIKKALVDFPEDGQIVFTGHSLGGAMAAICLFDLVNNKIVTTTANSPVLITYGSPRPGNYALANEINKMAPIIYRHANNWDLVTGVKGCYKSKQNCYNEFAETELNKDSKYVIKNPKDAKYFWPWHTRGLIINRSDTESENCVNVSESQDTKCRPIISAAFGFHKIYFGYKVSDMWKPEVFIYDIFTNLTCAADKDIDHPIEIDSQGPKDFTPEDDRKKINPMPTVKSEQIYQKVEDAKNAQYTVTKVAGKVVSGICQTLFWSVGAKGKK